MNSGSVFGIVGGGQLGRMTAQAAQRLGFQVSIYDPDPHSPAGMIAQATSTGAFDDTEAMAKFASRCDVLSYEFENISADALRMAARHAPLYPHPTVIEICQNRVREKAFLSSFGFPCARYREVSSAQEAISAAEELGCPVVLKTADFGYDGKGQSLIESPQAVVHAWDLLNAPRGVLEVWVPFEKEISVICSRGRDGKMAVFCPVENRHRHHILDVTIAPASLEPKVAAQALDLAKAIAERLGVVGLLAVEMFLMPDDSLLVNELAPRPHNSGHHTIESCITNQFEQFVRAVCGLPLGSAEMIRPAAMVNLLGDLWSNGEPNWAAALAFPEVKLHLYGKTTSKPGRKMGHLTALGVNAEEACSRVLAARQSLLRA